MTPLNKDAQDLEEAFFAEENRRLLDRLREETVHEERLRALRAIVKTDDTVFLERLLELGIGPETVLAMTLLPLAVVAWADGALDPREREAILKAAAQRGTSPGTPGRALLETWLARKPPASLVEIWKRYMRAVWADLDEENRLHMRTSIIDSAREVAEASGGLLGLTSKVSAAERAALQELERALG